MATERVCPEGAREGLPTAFVCVARGNILLPVGCQLVVIWLSVGCRTSVPSGYQTKAPERLYPINALFFRSAYVSSMLSSVRMFFEDSL